MWETWVQSLGWEDALEKKMATHPSILACRIPWTEEPCVHGVTKSLTQRVTLSLFFFDMPTVAPLPPHPHDLYLSVSLLSHKMGRDPSLAFFFYTLNNKTMPGHRVLRAYD